MAIISSRQFSFLCSLVILVPLAFSQPFWFQYCFNNTGYYAANSAYQSNLKTLLSSLTSNTEIDYGFYNFSYGKDLDKVSAIGLCKGDVKPNGCRGCLNNAIVRLPQVCPNQIEAMGSYDECMLHYSNRPIFGVLDSNYPLCVGNVTKAIEVDQYNQVVRELLERLIKEAVAGDSCKKFAAENDDGPTFQTIYGLVQCTPDLSEQDCDDCLRTAMGKIPYCCNSRVGCRVLGPSCNIRYENFRFFDPAQPLSPPQESPPTLPPPSIHADSTKGKRNTLRTIIAIVVPIVAFVVAFIFIYIYLRVRKQKESTQHTDDEIELSTPMQFDFDTIRVATSNFSHTNKLGQGGFGPVYKGRLSNGQFVAVKRLLRDYGQGDAEFKNEVLLLAKLHNRHLIRLLGFCLEIGERLLVYESVPNKSLDYFIFDPFHRAQLDWKMRYKIIVGIARGLLYLHEDSRLRIVHRDLKASNILLDEKMNPKISDFGLAKLFAIDQSQHKTTNICGTRGYMAPEYLHHGQFSVKSDVFSFGVLVLEIVSGQKNSRINLKESGEDLLSFAWKNWRERSTFNIIDPELNNGLVNEIARNEIMKCIHIGLLCIQEDVKERPTMYSVLFMFNSHSLTLPIPSSPAYCSDSGSSEVVHSLTQYNSGTTTWIQDTHSENQVTITELSPR